MIRSIKSINDKCLRRNKIVSKFYLKKSYVNAHICVDDYHENVKNEEKLKQKLSLRIMQR